MAKSIDLSAQAAKSESNKQASFSTPPPASPPASQSPDRQEDTPTLSRPLPRGRVIQVTGDDPVAQLKQGQWNEVDTPDDARNLVETALAADPDPQTPDPDTPRMQVEVKNLDEMPEGERQRLHEAMVQTLQQQQDQPQPQSQPQSQPQPQSQQSQPPGSSSQTRRSPVVTADDFESGTHEHNVSGDTGADKSRTNCPHCGWDLSQPDLVEPTDAEKASFVQSVLGQKPFNRSYTLLGGNVRMVFRTLTIDEIDACQRVAYRERDEGKLHSAMDFIERVNRLRLFLQLQRVVSGQFDHDLPEGLDKKTNPNADTHWELDATSEDKLLQIERFLLDNVLVNETFTRTAMRQCANFNRLVDKLESMIDNSDFWKATDG